MKTEFNYKIAPKPDGSIGVLRSTSLAFAIVVRDVTVRRELDTIKLAINVTLFFSFLIREGTWALQRPVAAFSKKQVWLIMRNQFAYLSWIVEDTNVSMYWSFRVTCASWWQSQRTGLPFLCQNAVWARPSVHEWRDWASPFGTVSQAWVSMIHIKGLASVV